MPANYTKRVIIVGKSGNGKSSLGNNLLGRNVFLKEGGFNAVTKSCQLEQTPDIAVVDTPGLFDTDRNINIADQALKVVEGLKISPGHPHAFLVVVGFNRFTAEELSVIDVLRITFGERCLEQAVVVVSHVGNDVADSAFKDACNKSEKVVDLLKHCGDRVVRIDNTDPKEEHLDMILSHIDQVSLNGQNCFKNDYFWCHEEVLKREANLNKYDSTPVHKQVEVLSKKNRTESRRRSQKS